MKLVLMTTGGLVAILAIYACADDGEWTKVTTPYKIGPVNDLRTGYDFSDQHYIFAATGTDGQTGKLWRSANEGVEWENITFVHDPGYYFYRIAIEQDDFNEGWLLVRGPNDLQAGPYKTTDRGNTWERKVAGLTGSLQFTALAARSVEGNLTNVFIGRTASAAEAKVFRWEDDHWVQASSGLPLDEEGTVYDLDISPFNALRIVCAYEGGVGHSGIYVSNDGGFSWVRTDFTGGGGSAIQAKIHPDPTDPNYVTVGEKNPMYGRLWGIKPGHPPYQTIPDYLPPDWLDCPDIEAYTRGDCAANYFAFSIPDNTGTDWTVASRFG